MSDAVTARKMPGLKTEPDDEALIARIAAGDEVAFRLMVERYTGLVFSLAFRMRFNHAAAEDVVQETWLRLWRHAGDWKKEKGASVRTWICRIAVNLCIDRTRKLSRETGEQAAEEADSSPDAEEQMKSGETNKILKQAIQTLPERQRSALVLFHYEEMAVAEIAAVLKTSAKSVEGLLGRARQALKKELAAYEGAL